MNDDTISDLKQFIATTVKQETSELKRDINNLDKKLSKRLDDVEDKLDTVIEATGEQLNDHDKRLTKLEVKTI